MRAHRIYKFGCPPEIAVDFEADDAAKARHLVRRDVEVWMAL